MTGVFREMPADCCSPSFGVHGVMRVAIAGLDGMLRVLITHGGASLRGWSPLAVGS